MTGVFVGLVIGHVSHAATADVQATANFKFKTPSQVESDEYVKANCPEPGQWRWLKINGQDIKVCR